MAERFDAGVRFGETVASGMISVRIAPDARMAVVGSPSYFAERKRRRVPQDLTAHKCINLRLPTHVNGGQNPRLSGGRIVLMSVEGCPDSP